jgi:hypothetical protein
MMLQTYKAILKGNRLEWERAPQRANPDAPITVYVTIVDEELGVENAQRGQRMAAILNQLAQTGGTQTIQDPLAWEREQRRERDLPYRNA